MRKMQTKDPKRSRRLKPITLMLTLACVFVTGAKLDAKESAHLRLRISWEGQKPESVVRSTRDSGDVPIPNTSKTLIINEIFPLASHDTMLRFDGVSSRSYLSFLPSYSDKEFQFRLKIPNGRDCHTERVVRPLTKAVKQSDVSTVASATILARHLVSERACGPHNERRLKEAYFNGYSQLTLIGDVFAMPDIEWGSYATRAKLAQRDARVRKIQALFNETHSMRNDQHFAKLNTRVDELDELMNVPEWKPIFGSAVVSQNALRHLKVVSLYNLAVSLRNGGDLQAAKGYSAQLAEIAQDNLYNDIFDQRNEHYARVKKSEAINIHEGILARIELAKAALTQP